MCLRVARGAKELDAACRDDASDAHDDGGRRLDGEQRHLVSMAIVGIATRGGESKSRRRAAAFSRPPSVFADAAAGHEPSAPASDPAEGHIIKTFSKFS